MEQKCKAFLNDNMVDYEALTSSSDVFCLYTNMFIQIILNIPVEKLKDSPTLTIAVHLF